MYKKMFTVCMLLCAVCSAAFCQDLAPETYKAASIPDSLKEGANAVVRYSSEELIIKGPGKILRKFHKVITILNEKGDRYAGVVLYYDKKFSSVNGVSIVVYDADGKKIKKYSKSDMYDRSAIDGISIVTDDRVLMGGHDIATYPATIETVYETDANSYLDLGSWHIQNAEVAVQYSEYKVSVNQQLGFRYKNKNTKITPVKMMLDGLERYTWTIKNLKAVKPEDSSADWATLPVIDFATNTFSFNGIPGNIDTWQNYGKWINTLNADVNSLTPQRAEEIKKMTAHLSTDKEKAKFLYEYLQHNMRYVSIQLGIGGLKPFPAMFVDQKKYGDCKALSNYMAALLKAVNIKSYYTIINAGENAEPADPSFPSDPFNHIILCVPFKSDTTWLECTSNTQPFGVLGAFTENRNALLVTEDGGKLVSTPRSKAAENVFNSEVDIKLNSDGGARTLIKIKGTGEYRSLYLGLAEEKTDEQKEFMLRTMKIKPPVSFEFKPAEDKDGVKEVNIELDYDKFCDVAAGNKQFYRPAAFSIWSYTCPVLEKRKTAFYFEHPLQKNCVTNIELPEGFEVETLPASQNVKFTYGSYDVKYEYDAAKNKVVSTARFILNEHVIPAAKYTEMQQYMDAVAKAQNKKLVIRRKA
jgi:hypothetical protein